MSIDQNANSLRAEQMISDWISTKDAAELTGYNEQHIRRLLRSKLVEGKKWGRDWMVSKSLC